MTLAICFIYEASINLWCDLTTLLSYQQSWRNCLYCLTGIGVVHDIIISPGTWRFSAKCEWSMFLNLSLNSCWSMMWWSELRYVTTWPRHRLANIHAGVNLLQSYAESIFRSDHPPGGGPGHSKPTYQPQSECVTTLHMFSGHCSWWG